MAREGSADGGEAVHSAWVMRERGHGGEERHWRGVPGHKKLVAGLP